MKGAATWAGIEVPVITPTGWSRPEILAGLSELERLRRCVDAATAELIVGLDPDARDTAATVAKATRAGAKAGRDRTRVAGVVGKVRGAGAALAAGDVSADHLKALARVSDPEAAAGLLGVAAAQTPEEFAETVAKHLLDNEGDDLEKKQRDARSVRFFDAEHGCLGVRIVLTPLEGEELRNRLTAIADEIFRAAHPERARKLGELDLEPMERRLADAFMAMVRGTTETGGRPTVVVTVDLETMEANLAGAGPVSTRDAMDLTVDPRTEIYAYVRSMRGEILKFGTSRRFASAMQRLALIVRDGRCAEPGCDRHWRYTEAHHRDDAATGGRTDVDDLELRCKPHHQHEHLDPERREERAQRRRSQDRGDGSDGCDGDGRERGGGERGDGREEADDGSRGRAA